MKETRVWFVTDIHGSDLCFRKLLNSVRWRKNPNVLIVGGDITGKQVVPIVKSAKAWKARFEGCYHELSSNGEVNEFVNKIADHGAYGFVCSNGQYDELLSAPTAQAEIIRKLQSERLNKWMEMADERLRNTGCRLLINSGNDDDFFVDEILQQSEQVEFLEGNTVNLNDDLAMVSCGYTNMSPWKCPRDIDDRELGEKLTAMIGSLNGGKDFVLNCHAPPINSLLDQAVRIDEQLQPSMSAFGVEHASIGSRAVREAIEQYQPVVGLHGHVHDQHVFERIGRTVCFNPGTEYSEGNLRGVFLLFFGAELKNFGLTREDFLK